MGSKIEGGSGLCPNFRARAGSLRAAVRRSRSNKATKWEGLGAPMSQGLTSLSELCVVSNRVKDQGAPDIRNSGQGSKVNVAEIENMT